jgi:tetratricopeptide (TPR) repeat protein
LFVLCFGATGSRSVPYWVWRRIPVTDPPLWRCVFMKGNRRWARILSPGLAVTPRISLLLFSIVLVLAAGCGNRWISGGKLHFDQGRYEKARENFQQAIDEEPQNGVAHMWLGRSLAELDNASAASEEFTKAVESTPKLSGQVQTMRDHYWTDHYNDGLRVAQVAHEEKEKANMETAEGKFAAAIEEFRKATIYNPEKTKAWMNIGKIHFQLARVDSAIAMFKKVHRMAPNDPDAKEDEIVDLLFNIYRKLGDEAYETKTADGFRSSIRLYREAEQLKPEDVDLLFQMGAASAALADGLREEKGEVDDEQLELLRSSAGYYDRLLAQQPDDMDVLYNVALVYRDLGEHEKALAAARHLVDLNPTEAAYHLLLGRVASKVEDTDVDFYGEIIFASVLADGTVEVNPDIREMVDRVCPPASDMKRVYRERGDPEEVRRWTDATGQQYVWWCYWTSGHAAAFIDCEKRYEIYFRALREKPSMGGDGD